MVQSSFKTRCPPAQLKEFSAASQSNCWANMALLACGFLCYVWELGISCDLPADVVVAASTGDGLDLRAVPAHQESKLPDATEAGLDFGAKQIRAFFLEVPLRLPCMTGMIGIFQKQVVSLTV